MTQDVLNLVRELDDLTTVKLLRHVGPMLFKIPEIERLVETFPISTGPLADLTNLPLTQKREALSSDRSIWLARVLLAALASQRLFAEILAEALNSLYHDELDIKAGVTRGLVTDLVRLLASAREKAEMERGRVMYSRIERQGGPLETGGSASDILVDLAMVALAPESTPLPATGASSTSQEPPERAQVTTTPGLSDKPIFYFKLEGEGVSGNQVRCGSNADLIFNYDVSSQDVLVEFTGKGLEEIRQRSGSLDLTIIPHGFLVRDGVWTRTAQFEEGRLKEAVRFGLRSDDESRRNSGVLVLFRVNGALIYEYFLRIQLVAAISLSAIPKLKPIDINLDNVLEAKKNRDQRDYVLNIQAVNGQYILQRERNKKHLPILVSTIGPAKLASLLLQSNTSLNKIINKSVLFSRDHHSFNPGQNSQTQGELQKFMQSMATIGSQLYTELASEDENGFGTVLREINDLPPNSRIAIHTDRCFIPWGILYPHQFNEDWPDKKKRDLSPQNFWGYRFLIECLLIGLDSDSESHQPQAIQKEVFVSLNINQSIDDKLKDNLSLAIQSHKTFFEHTVTTLLGEIHNTPEDIKALLNNKEARANFIYFYCHGQNKNPFKDDQKEIIEIAPKQTIDPSYIYKEQKFEGHPIIFLNSCSAGAISPLSFLGFSKRFKQAGADGMIVPDFAVPIKFAAAFGQEVIHRYLDGQTIGSALLELRRILVDHMNPLGLLYSLQCPMDARVERAELVSVT